MDTGNLSGFQEIEAQWVEATGALARCEAALGEAMRAYRQNSPDCRPTRIAQALANQEAAKQSVNSLMHSIWAKLN